MCSKQEDGTWENGKLLVCPDNGVCYSFALGKPFQFHKIIINYFQFVKVGTVGNATGLDLRFKGCGPASSEIGCTNYTIPALVSTMKCH